MLGSTIPKVSILPIQYNLKWVLILDAKRIDTDTGSSNNQLDFVANGKSGAYPEIFNRWGRPYLQWS